MGQFLCHIRNLFDSSWRRLSHDADWPAIDLRGGKCVRLQQGDYSRETIFGEDPLAMARHFVSEGAEYLHLVDLDGAREGRPANLASVQAIVEGIPIPCELGGGIRDEATIQQLLDLGVTRLVLGTKALREPAWFRACAVAGRVGLRSAWMPRTAGGHRRLAGRERHARRRSWHTSSPMNRWLPSSTRTLPPTACWPGPNLAAMAEMRETIDLPLIASGGVTRAADVASLAALGVAGCIIGRALYEGTLTMAEARSPRGGRPDHPGFDIDPLRLKTAALETDTASKES